MHENDACKSRYQKRAQCGIGSAVEVTEDRRECETHKNRNRNIVFVLEPSQAVFLKIAHPSERGVGPAAEEQPANVGMKKATGNIIGIIIVIHKFMVTAMVGRPSQRGTLKSCGSEKQGVKLDDRVCFEREVRKKAMIAERDAHACGDGKKKKECELKKADAILPDVIWHGRAGHEEGSDQEDAVSDPDFA